MRRRAPRRRRATLLQPRRCSRRGRLRAAQRAPARELDMRCGGPRRTHGQRRPRDVCALWLSLTSERAVVASRNFPPSLTWQSRATPPSMVAFCVSPGVAALPARRRARPSAAQGSRPRRALTSGPLLRAARCAPRVRALAASGNSNSGGGSPAGGADAHLEDANWVQTALNKAVEQEDYARASQCVPSAHLGSPRAARCLLRAALRRATRRRLRDRLRKLVGEWAGPTDWYGLGVPKWLADRAERLGFRSPTEARCVPLLVGAAASALTRQRNRSSAASCRPQTPAWTWCCAAAQALARRWRFCCQRWPVRAPDCAAATDCSDATPCPALQT